MSTLIEWNTQTVSGMDRRKQASPLAYFLIFVFSLFIGILVFCYAATKRTNVIYLDEQGKPVSTGPSSTPK